MSFRKFVNDNMICEEVVNSASDVEALYEGLESVESELNEVLGLGKLADKMKKLSDKGDKAVETAKEKGKEFVSDAKYVAKNLVKDSAKASAENVKEVVGSHVEIAKAAKDKLMGLLSKSQDVMKDLWGSVKPMSLSKDQLEMFDQMGDIFAKMSSGRFLNSEESVKVLATILAGGTSKEIPSAKAVQRQLDRLNAIPGFKTIKLSVKSTKEKA